MWSSCSEATLRAVRRRCDRGVVAHLPLPALASPHARSGSCVNGRVKASITTGPVSAGSFSCPWAARRVGERELQRHQSDRHDEQRDHHGGGCVQNILQRVDRPRAVSAALAADLHPRHGRCVGRALTARNVSTERPDHSPSSAPPTITPNVGAMQPTATVPFTA